MLRQKKEGQDKSLEAQALLIALKIVQKHHPKGSSQKTIQIEKKGRN